MTINALLRRHLTTNRQLRILPNSSLTNTLKNIRNNNAAVSIPALQSPYRRTFSSANASKNNNNNDDATKKPFYWDNPGDFVQGVTTSQLETNPTIAAFFAANFQEEDYAHLRRFQKTVTRDGGDETTTTSVLKVPEPAYQKKPDPGAESPLIGLNIRNLPAFLRERRGGDGGVDEGSNRCRVLRQEGMIPGLIYGREYHNQKMSDGGRVERVFVKTPENFIQREVDKFAWYWQYRVYRLCLEGQEPLLVTPADCNEHPVYNMFFCINYRRYYPGRSIKLAVKYVNEEDSPLLKRGGFIIPLKRMVNVVIEDGVPIPDFLGIDCTGLKRKNVVKLDRLILPDGIKICKTVDQENFMFGTTRGKRTEPAVVVEEVE